MSVRLVVMMPAMHTMIREYEMSTEMRQDGTENVTIAGAGNNDSEWHGSRL